jgi:hypothetical protein
MTRARVACTLLAAGLLISACGSSGGSGGGGEADKTADQILADAVAAMKTVKSVHVVARETSSAASSGLGNLILDIDVASADSAAGSITGTGVAAKFVFSAGKFYLQGKDFFAKLAGPQAAAVIGDRWVIVPSSAGLSGFEQFVNPGTLADCLSVDHGTLSKDGTTTVDGTAAVVLTDKGDKAGTQPGKLYVATEGTAYPLKLEVTGKATPGTPPGGAKCGGGSSDTGSTGVVTFTQFNGTFTVTVPSNAVDLQSLMGGA